ncbi:diguanylate cyclase [Arthrobacter sp. MDT3-24]
MIERSRAAVENLGIAHTGDPSGVLTISAGISAYRPGHRIGREELLAEADTALYAAKTTGRNKVTVSDAVHT